MDNQTYERMAKVLEGDRKKQSQRDGAEKDGRDGGWKRERKGGRER